MASSSGGGEHKPVMDLAPLMQKVVRVKCNGGREYRGVLKGFDKLMNMVLDETVEFMRDPKDPDCTTDVSRKLGIMVCRGPTVMAVSPEEGYEEIANPFEAAEGEEDEEAEAGDAAGEAVPSSN